MKRPDIARYALALVAAVAAYALTKEAVEVAGAARFMLFFAAVAVSAYFGGRGPGILATCLSILLAPLTRPLDSREPMAVEWLLIALFAVTALVITLLTSRLKKREMEAREHETWLRVVLRSVAEGVVVTNPQREVTLMNPQAEALTGLRQEEALGQPVEQVVMLRDEATGERTSACLGALVEGAISGTQKESLILVSADRSERPIDCSAAPIRELDGALVGAVVSLRDLTRLRRADALVRQNEAELEDFFENAPIALSWVSTDGTILRANKAELELVACDRDHYVGRNLREFLAAGPQASLVLDGLERGETLDGVEARLECGENSLKDVRISSSGFVRDGTLMHHRLFKRDITAQKRAEQESRKARTEAESASRAKDQFLAVLSHELRTPLTPVALALTELADSPGLSSELKNRLTMIQRNVQLEVRLIEDLLDVTRIAQGKLLVHRERTDIHALIRYVLDICDTDVQNRHQALTTDLAAVRYEVFGDPARLQQALWNLVKNAVKFTPERGGIQVRTRNTPQQSIVVEVSDTGIGFAPDAQRRIFEAFQQAGTTSQHIYGGLGLGLAISHAIIEAHGGSLIGASPGPGRGATFTLELPTLDRAAQVEATPEPAAPSSARTARLRVLLVEDHQDTRRLLSQLLEKKNCVVSCAASLTTAVQLADEDHFDVLVSDLGLPDGSGIDLVRQLRKPIPAIALSGYATEKDIAASLDAGFAEHLTKPVDFERLLQMIHKLASPLREPRIGSSNGR
jgi:two-component system CheB/CheR fusion protein